MKKICAALVCMLLAVLTAGANTASWSASSYATANGWTSGTTKVGNTDIRVNDDISFRITDYGTEPLFSGDAVRVYKNSKITFTCASGVKLTSMVITGESSTYTAQPQSVSQGTITKSGATLTWSGSTNTLEVLCSNASSNNQLRIKTIEFTYTGGTGTSTGGGNTGGGTTTEPETPATGDGTVVYFIAPDYTGQSGTKLINSDGSTSVSSGTASASLVGQSFTSGNVTISFARTSGSYMASFGALVRWYANNTITLTPESGYAITRVEVPYSGSSYKGPFTASEGTVDSSGNPVVWTGTATSPLTLTPSVQMRFAYIAVTVAKTGSTGGGNTGGGNTGDNDDQFTPIYILGDMNGWQPSDAWKFSTTDGVNYTLKVKEMPAVSEFKIADANYAIANWGGCTAIRPNIEYYLLWNQGNATMDAISADATITFNANTHGFKVSSTKTTGGMAVPSGYAQGWPAEYEGVMLQGFYWDSYEDSNWANLEYYATELSHFFKLIWLPNSARPASNPGMGYDPVYWFTNYDSSFGSEKALRSLAKTLKAKGTGLIADVVVNHRSGQSNWTDFPAETWRGITYHLDHRHITANDEVAWVSGQPTPGGNYDTGDNFDGSRDLDHTNALVQANVKAYCQFLLEDIGYAGFRWDMVKGYGGGFIKLYNDYSVPTFSVGEYFDTDYNNVAGWIESTGRTSAAFDFPFKFAVNDAFASGDMRKLVWVANGNNQQPAGLIHNTYGRYAVTFVENHDTARDHSAFSGNVLAANAFMLMSPGTPCVFLPHWNQYKQQLAYLIALRNAVGIHNCSSVQVLRSTSDCYMAKVFGKYGDAIVKIGPAMVTPDGFNDADLKAYGPDYAVWTKVHVSGQEIPREYPTNLYLIGNVNSNNWSTTNPVQPSSKSNGVYTWNNVTINRADGGAYGYFSLVSTKGANWDVVNAGHRFGAYTDSEPINGTAGIKAYPAGFNSSAARNWALAPGQYKVVVDMNAMTISVTSNSNPGQTTVYFVAPDYTTITGTALVNADGTSAGSASNNLLNKSFTADNKVIFTYTGGGSSKAAAYGNLVRWYKGNNFTLQAASGYAISRVEVAYTASSYAGPFTASSGVVDASANPVVWKGNTTSLTLTASGQMRFSYIAVTLEPSDESAPVVEDVVGAIYEPVNYLSDLREGGKYIIVVPSSGKALGSTFSKTTNGYLNAVEVTVGADKSAYAADPSDILEFTLERGSNASSYSMSFEGEDGKTYYLAAPSTSTTLSRTATKSTSNNITITQGASLHTILFVKNNRRLNYGTANGGCFQAYAASSASKVQIYKRVSSVGKTINIANSRIVNFVAPEVDEIDGAVAMVNSDGSTTATGSGPSDATLHQVQHNALDADDAALVTLENTYAKGSYPAAFGDHVRWYKNAVFTLTPAAGYKITRVEVEHKGAQYAGPFSAEQGAVAADFERSLLIWTGESNGALALTADEQIRFSSMSVTLKATGVDTPATEQFEAPVGMYVCLDNEAEWDQPYAYTWTTGDADRNAPWPGVAMTRTVDGSNKWIYQFDADAAPAFIIFNDGNVGSGVQTEDMLFVNQATYSNTEFDGIHELYLVGNFTDNWTFLDQYRFASDDGVAYTLDVEKLPKFGQFKIASKFYAPLDFGGASTGGLTTIKADRFIEFVPDSSTNVVMAQEIKDATMAFNIDTAEIYIEGTVVEVTGVEDVQVESAETPVWYNLQGVRVEHPASGTIVIEVRGNTAIKRVVK